MRPDGRSECCSSPSRLDVLLLGPLLQLSHAPVLEPVVPSARTFTLGGRRAKASHRIPPSPLTATLARIGGASKDETPGAPPNASLANVMLSFPSNWERLRPESSHQRAFPQHFTIVFTRYLAFPLDQDGGVGSARAIEARQRAHER